MSKNKREIKVQKEKGIESPNRKGEKVNWLKKKKSFLRPRCKIAVKKNSKATEIGNEEKRRKSWENHGLFSENGHGDEEIKDFEIEGSR